MLMANIHDYSVTMETNTLNMYSQLQEWSKLLQVELADNKHKINSLQVHKLNT